MQKTGTSTDNPLSSMYNGSIQVNPPLKFPPLNKNPYGAILPPHGTYIILSSLILRY